MSEYTSAPSGLTIETPTGVVHVPQTVEAEGGEAVAAYVATAASPQEE